MVKWLRAWRSFLRGRDGLSDWDLIERNLLVARGNLVIVALLIVVALVRAVL